MKEEEYKSKLAEIEARFKTEKDNLAKKYAYENATFIIGDIITDSHCTIIVDKIKWSYGYAGAIPVAVYCGRELKKDLTPKKNGDTNTIYNYPTREIIKLNQNGK